MGWRGQVEDRVIDLQDDLACAREANPGRPVHDGIAEANIERAHEIAASAPTLLGITWYRRWASGADIEAAWSAIHNAEAALVMLLPAQTVHARLADLRSAVVSLLDGDRVDEFHTYLQSVESGGPSAIDLGARERIRAIKSAVDAASDTAHLNIRNYRNWLLIVMAVVSAGLIGLSIAHAAAHGFVFIAGDSTGRHGADIGQLAAAGAVGGLLMALFSLIRLKAYSGPVSLPLWLALARVPAGGVAAVVGAALIQGRVISLVAPQGRSGLIGYAVLFGAAPELVLRFLDRRVNEITAAARSPSDPMKKVPKKGTATTL